MTQPPNNGAWPQSPYSPQNQVPQSGAQPTIPQPGYQGQPFQPQAGQSFSFPPGQPGFAAQPVMAAPPAKKKSKVPVIVGLTLAVALTVGGALAAFTFFRGSTVRAAKALPSNSLAVVEVNLAPSGEQQLALLTWGKRFPSLQKEVQGTDYKQSLYKAVTKDSGTAPEWKDVEPWLGDSVAFAVVKDADGKPKPLTSIAVKDRAAAQRFMKTNENAKDKKFEFIDDTLLVWNSETNLSLDKSAIKKSPVTEQETYKELMKRLPEANLGTAYATGEGMAEITKVLSSTLGTDAVDQLEDLEGSASAYALVASNDTLTLEAASKESKTSTPGADVRPLINEMSADSMFVGAVGLNDTLVQEMWGKLEPELLKNSKVTSTLGLNSAADLKGLLGSQFGIQIPANVTMENPDFAFKVKGADSTRIKKLIKDAQLGDYVTVRTSGDVTAVTLEGSTLADTPAKKIGSLDSFKKAIGDGPAQAVFWVNTTELHTMLKDLDSTDAKIDELLEPLASIGITANYEDNGQFSKAVIKVTAKS